MRELLVHYDTAYIRTADSMPQVKGFDANRHDKPQGLWVSADHCEHNWRWWCEAENFNKHRLTHRTQVVLKPDAKILRLKSPEAIDDFTQIYLMRDKLPPQIQRLAMAKNMFIDWARVAESYGGIIIAPYQWSRRLATETMWYYSWDCASGVIWDADTIKELIPLTAWRRWVNRIKKGTVFDEDKETYEEPRAETEIQAL